MHDVMSYIAIKKVFKLLSLTTVPLSEFPLSAEGAVLEAGPWHDTSRIPGGVWSSFAGVLPFLPANKIAYRGARGFSMLLVH